MDVVIIHGYQDITDFVTTKIPTYQRLSVPRSAANVSTIHGTTPIIFHDTLLSPLCTVLGRIRPPPLIRPLPNPSFSTLPSEGPPLTLTRVWISHSSHPLTFQKVRRLYCIRYLVSIPTTSPYSLLNVIPTSTSYHIWSVLSSHQCLL